jgi:hypothetical protein
MANPSHNPPYPLSDQMVCEGLLAPFVKGFRASFQVAVKGVKGLAGVWPNHACARAIARRDGDLWLGRKNPSHSSQLFTVEPVYTPVNSCRNARKLLTTFNSAKPRPESRRGCSFPRLLPYLLPTFTGVVRLVFECKVFVILIGGRKEGQREGRSNDYV